MRKKVKAKYFDYAEEEKVITLSEGRCFRPFFCPVFIANSFFFHVDAVNGVQSSHHQASARTQEK